jgi:Cu/Ag efflux protein CusF
MTASKAYLILGLALVAGLTVAGATAEKPAPPAAVHNHEGHDQEAHGGGEAAKMATYTFKGVVTAIDVAASKVTIDHEKIGDYMEAMTMQFDVADPTMLEGLKVGDEKAFVLHVNPMMTAIVGIGSPEQAAQK